MGTNAAAVNGKCLKGIIFSLSFILLATVSAAPCPVPKERGEQGHTLMARLEAPEGDVLKAVQEVTQDQIIHGTYSYEKERILYGAHSANSAGVFGGWPGPGKAFYKVASKVLSPRFHKNYCGRGSWPGRAFDFFPAVVLRSVSHDIGCFVAPPEDKRWR